MTRTDGERTDRKVLPTDLLKVVGAGIVGGVVGRIVGGGVKNVWELLGENKSFEMANKICGSIVEAETLGDKSSELTARKAALSWLFAESAVIVAPYVGYDSASRLLRHYLYGDGRMMDVSDDIQHLSGDKSFWNQMFGKGFAHIVTRDLGDNLAGIESKFKSVLQYYIAQLEKGVKFQAQTPKEGLSEKLGLFYSFGTSEYQLLADEPKVVTISDQSVMIEVAKAALTMQDNYDWTPGDFNPGLVYLSRMTGLVINEAFNSLGLDRIVRTVIINSGVSAWQKQLLYENYLGCKDKFDTLASSMIGETSRRFEGMVMGEDATGNYAFDLSLLADYGAKPFPMSATINFDGEKIEMPI